MFLFGKNIVSLSDNNELNFSPLRNVEGTSFVSNSNELKIALKKFSSNEDGNHKINNEIFYLNNNFSRWLNL